jgi:hypothetical protein
LQREVEQAMQDWKSTVFPEIDRAVKERNTARLLDALRRASDINWKFHRACAERYFEIVTKHSDEATDLLNSV